MEALEGIKISIDKLKELKLGVDTKLTETVDIKNEWFNNL